MESCERKRPLLGRLIGGLRIGRARLGSLTPYVETLRQGSWMLVAMVTVGVLNYLTNAFVGRTLGPSDYGIFTALTAVSLVVGVVAEAVQTVVTNYVVHLQSKGAIAEIGALSVHLLKRLLPWGIGGALVLSLSARPVATFLQIPSPLPVVVVSIFLIPTAVLPAVQGVLRGLQRFGALGWTQVSMAIIRLAVAVGLVTVGLGAAGAVAALPLSGLGAFTLGIVLLEDVLSRRESIAVPRLDGLFGYSLSAILALVCFTILTQGDVILVKSRFSSTEAGLYSAIAVLGKTTLWLSGAVTALLLPKATQQHSQGQQVGRLLRNSLLAVVALCGTITLVFFLFSSLIVTAFFGRQYLDNASLLGPYGLAMTFYSLVNVCLIYYLAAREYRYSYILLAGAALQSVLLAVLPPSLVATVGVLIGVGACMAVVGIWGIQKGQSLWRNEP